MVGAYRVQMTQMPQLVALFNGVGGGAAAIVALIELHTPGPADRPRVPERLEPAVVPWWQFIPSPSPILVGSVSFAGSMVTFLKLQELMTTRPIIFAGYSAALRPRCCSPRSASPS